MFESSTSFLERRWLHQVESCPVAVSPRVAVKADVGVAFFATKNPSVDCRHLVYGTGLVGDSFLQAVDEVLLSLFGVDLHGGSPGVPGSCEIFPRLRVDSSTLHVPCAGSFKRSMGRLEV